MKSFVISIVLVLITTISYSQNQLYVEVEITGNRVNIRTEPNLTCKVVYQKNWGDTFLGARYNDEWYELLDDDGNVYYGYHKYIKEITSTNTAVSTPSSSNTTYTPSSTIVNSTSTSPSQPASSNYGIVTSSTLTEKKYPIAKTYPIGQEPKSTVSNSTIKNYEPVEEIVEEIVYEEEVIEHPPMVDLSVEKEEIKEIVETTKPTASLPKNTVKEKVEDVIEEVKEVEPVVEKITEVKTKPNKEVNTAIDIPEPKIEKETITEKAPIAKPVKVVETVEVVEEIVEEVIDIPEPKVEETKIVETPISEEVETIKEVVSEKENVEVEVSDPQDVAFQNAQAQLEELTLHIQLEDNTKARNTAISIINNHVDHSTFTHLGSCVLVGEEAYNKYRSTLSNDGSRIPEMRKLLNDVYDPLIINLIRLDIVDNWIQKEEYQYALDIMENIMTHNSESLTLPKHCEDDPNRKATPQIELKNKYFLVYHLLDKKKKEEILGKLKSLTSAKNPVTQSIAKDIYEKLSGDFWEKN